MFVEYARILVFHHVVVGDAADVSEVHAVSC
jgi:hypothetical protein